MKNIVEISAKVKDWPISQLAPPPTSHPYFRLCQLQYTHILAYERLSSEWPRFVSSASLPSPALQLPWENRGTPGSLSKYFANISR